MKEIFKQFYAFISKLLKTIISFLSVLFFSSFSSNKKIKKLRDHVLVYDECIVMGNGPSLNPVLIYNLCTLKHRNIFAVNFFCNTEYFNRLKPSFYLLQDPLLFANNIEDLSENMNLLVKNFNEISWPMVVLIPYGFDFKNSKLFKEIDNNNLLFFQFNVTPISGFKFAENWLFKHNLGMPASQTVINSAIFLAINLNYKIIHLYGVEQSWLKYLSVGNDNKISVGLSHFYSGSDKTGENRTLSEFLLSQATVFKSHLRLDEYSKHLGSYILNHTPGSYIDAYDRVV